MPSSVVEIIIKATDQSSNVIKQAADDWKIFAIGINQALEVVKKVADGFEQVFDYTRGGAEFVQTERAFSTLMESMGMSTAVLDDWRQAAGGIVTELDLMSGFQTLAAGMTEELTLAFAENNTKLLEISKAASALNPKLGDTAYMYESITRGIKRSSPLILDNLGILVKVGQANEKLAKSLGKTVEELTSEEQQMALLNEVLEKGDLLIQQLGGSADAATDPWDRFTTAMGNAKDVQASYISQNPALGAALEWGTNLVKHHTEQVMSMVEAEQVLKQAQELGIITTHEYKNHMQALSYSGVVNTEVIDELSGAIAEMTAEQEWAATQASGYAVMAALAAGATIEEAFAVAGLSEALEGLPDYAGVEIEIDVEAAMAELEKLQQKMETDLSRAMEVLVRAQEDWKSSLADDLVQGMQDAGVKGDELVTRLDAIDKALGTTLGAEHRYQVAYDLEMPELLQTLLDDPGQFVKDAAVFVDYFMPLEQSVVNAQAKVSELQAELDAIAKEYEVLIRLKTTGSIPDLPGGGGGGGAGSIGSPEMKATGGIVYPGHMYRWRELGDEYMMTTERGYVVPHRQAAAMMGGGGDGNVIVNIYTPFNFADQAWVERSLAPYIQKEMREALRT